MNLMAKADNLLLRPREGHQCLVHHLWHIAALLSRAGMSPRDLCATRFSVYFMVLIFSVGDLALMFVQELVHYQVVWSRVIMRTHMNQYEGH